MEKVNFINYATASTMKDNLGEYRDKIASEQDSVFAQICPDGKDRMDVLIADLTVADVDAMDKETFFSTFTDEDGSPIFIDNNDAKELEMFYDLVKNAITTRDAFKEIDGALEELNAGLEEYKEEMKEIMDSNSGSILLATKAQLVHSMNEFKDAGKPYEQYQPMINAIEDSVTLKPLFELYSKINPANTYAEFKNPVRRKEVTDKFLKICKSHGLKEKLSWCSQLETMLIDSKYVTVEGLFAFTAMRYINYNIGKSENALYVRTWMTSLTTLISLCFVTDKENVCDADLELIEDFKKNIVALNDLFII